MMSEFSRLPADRHSSWQEQMLYRRGEHVSTEQTADARPIMRWDTCTSALAVVRQATQLNCWDQQQTNKDHNERRII